MTRNLIIIAVLIVMGLIVFGNVIDSFFVGETLDYLGLINPRIYLHNLWGDPSWMSAHFARSAVRAQWGIEQYLFGKNPAGFHIVNIIFHALNCFLAYVLVRRILGPGKLAWVAGILSAIIFLVHSGPAENVRWITERWDLSMTFFYVIALLLFAEYRTQNGRWQFLAVSALSFGISLCSKEMGFSFPIMLLVYDIYYLDGYKEILRRKFRRLAAHLPFWVTTLLYFAYRFARHNSVSDYQNALEGTSSFVHSIAMYFSWLAYPFGRWAGAVMLVLVFLLGGKRLRFLVLFVLVALLPASRIPEVWRGYLPTFGFSMLWGAVLTRDWVGALYGKFPGVTQERVKRGLGIGMRVVQSLAVAVVIASNAYVTHEDNIDWDISATKSGFLAVQVKKDHATLPWGAEVYVVNAEQAADKILHPMFFTPPLVFMFDEIQVEASPFQQLYFNRLTRELPSREGLLIYVYSDGALHEAPDLREKLLVREEAPLVASDSVEILTQGWEAESARAHFTREGCLALSDLSLPADAINTLLLEIECSSRAPTKQLRGEIFWQPSDNLSPSLSATSAEFELVPDGTRRTYRLAVSSFASWFFADKIESLMLCIEGDKSDVEVVSIKGARMRYEQTDEKKPTWQGFDTPSHGFDLPRVFRMPKEKFDYFTFRR